MNNYCSGKDIGNGGGNGGVLFRCGGINIMYTGWTVMEGSNNIN